jgi:hypothetical protein
VGNSNSATALVYHNQSALFLKEIVGTVADGSVIEVYACKDAAVYRLANGLGYVLKQPVSTSSQLGGVWVHVQSNRYSCHLLEGEHDRDSDRTSEEVSLQRRNGMRLRYIGGIISEFDRIDNLRKTAFWKVQSSPTEENRVDVQSLQAHAFQDACALFELVI